MKVQTGLLTLVVAAGCAFGQSTPAATPKTAATPSQPTANASSKPAKKTTKSTKKTTTSTTAAPAAQPEGNVATNVATEPAKPATTRAGRRDPFMSPIQTRSNSPMNCGTGKRCLIVDQTTLQGIVKAPNGMIAVVSNSANKAYFLRENDPVYNGFVQRITPNSVVFREQVTDRLGRVSTREVVKKVNAPAV